MLPFRRVLFPVDYSEPCRAVVPYVREVLQRYSAELTVVHAYGAEALAMSHLPLSDPGLPGEAHEFELQRLRDFAAEMFPGQRVDAWTHVGEAGSVIHALVQHQGTDLVMLPTHGRGPVRRFLLGSVTTKVLHDVSAAVWTGTGSAIAEHTPSLPYKSILCALSEGPEAEAVLKAAAALAASYGAQLELLHVTPPPPITAEMDLGPYLEAMTDAAQSQMRELKSKLAVDAPHAVLTGVISATVREEALRRKADLLVTGRGLAQGALSRLWSHLYPLVRESPCPVLSI
ncbi:MAG TPA: universal stress protein [Bryobacteraceae bacterium]